MSQKTLGRRWAPSLAGSPHIRSVPSLGWVKVEEKGTIDCDIDMPEDLKKKRVKWAFERLIQMMKNEEGAVWDGKRPKLRGPFPHFNHQEPDMQYGDNGASRPVARNVQEDLTGTGKEDYVIIASFWVPERITEVRTPVAQKIFAEGKYGVRPLRERN